MNYVGTVATATAVSRPEYWVREMVRMNLVRDNRATRKKGLRLAFGLYEFYQLTALAAAFRYQKFVHIQHMPKWQEFNKALEDYVFDPNCKQTTYDIISTYDGYRAGWDFERLEQAASGNYAMAVRLEQGRGVTITKFHRLHAAL